MNPLFLTAFSYESKIVKEAFPTFAHYEIGQGEKSIKFFFQTKKKELLDYQDIYLVGFCGALNPKLELGSIVCPGVVRSEIGKHVISTSNTSLFTSSDIIGTKAMRENFFKKTECDVVDMESYFVAEFFLENDKNVSIIKSVMDTYEDTMPSLQLIKKDRELIKKLNNNLEIAGEKLKNHLCSLSID